MSPLPAPHGPHASGRAAAPRPGLPVLRGLCRGGLSALQRIRQRRSLRCSCPPLFSPRAPGDSPVLPRPPESAAGPGRAGRCPGHRATPGLCPCPGARCAAVVWQRRRRAWPDGGWSQGCGLGTGEAGRGMRSERSEGSTPWAGHQQPPPRLPVGDVSPWAVCHRAALWWCPGALEGRERTNMELGTARDGENDRDLHLSSKELVLLPLGWQRPALPWHGHGAGLALGPVGNFSQPRRGQQIPGTTQAQDRISRWSFPGPRGRLLPGAVPSVLGTALSQCTDLHVAPSQPWVSPVLQLRLHGGCSCRDLLPRAPRTMTPTSVPAITGEWGHRQPSPK